MQASNATLDQSMRVAKISEVKAAYWGGGRVFNKGSYIHPVLLIQ